MTNLDTVESRIYQLAKAAETTSLLTSLRSPEAHAELGKLRRGEARTHNVYLHRRSLRITLFLGGKQRILGLFNHGDTGSEKAFRYADMLVTYFWPYRKRKLHDKPLDSDLNFSLAQAESDIEDEHDFMALAAQIKASLVAADLLFPPEDKAPTVWALQRQIDVLTQRLNAIKPL